MLVWISQCRGDNTKKEIERYKNEPSFMCRDTFAAKDQKEQQWYKAQYVKPAQNPKMLRGML